MIEGFRKILISHFAFNHEQMKESTTAGYITAERKVFHDITDRLMNVNLEVLSELTKRMTNGERVKPETEQEKLCLKLINDLDHVNGHVSGSIGLFTVPL